VNAYKLWVIYSQLICLIKRILAFQERNVKMKKSILSIVVTLSMLFSFMPAVFAASNEAAAYSVKPDVTAVEQGDIVTFTVSVDNAELVSSIGAKLTYDPTKLVYISSERGSIYNYDYTSPSGKALNHDSAKHAIKALVGFKADEYHDITDTVLFKATFMVAGTAEPGTYSDYITVDEFSVFRGSTQYSLTGSVDELTISEGDLAYPMIVNASSSTVSMGSDITYTLSFASPVTLDSFQLLIDYDKDMLQYKTGTVIDGTTTDVSENGIVWASNQAKELNGTVATLTFTALKNGIASVSATDDSEAVKAVFPSVAIISDAKIKVTADKSTVSANDTVTYTAVLENDIAVKGLQLDLDFSDLHIKDCKAELGASLANIEAVANDTAFNNNVATVAFANSDIVTIPAGELARFTFTLDADLSNSYTPAVTDSSVTYGDSDFTADVDVEAIAPTPVTSLMNAVPNASTAQSGDIITYTVSLEKAINPKGFETHMHIDPAYVDGDITVKAVSNNIDVNFNKSTGDVTAVAFNYGENVALSGDLYTVTFKVKTDKNTSIAPSFTDIVVTGASVSASVVPVSIFAEGSATINVSSSTEYALPGSKVIYTFDLKDAKALKILNIDMSYDPAIYSSAEVKTADSAPLTATVDSTSGKINVIFMGANALSGDVSGLVTVEFKVADAPAPGKDNVQIDVKSDEYTKLTVNNNAKTSIVSSYGHIAVNTSHSYLYNTPAAEILTVTVTAEDITDLENLSFELAYDKNMFTKIAGPTVNKGAEANVIEEGRIKYVYTGDAIPASAGALMTIKLYPLESAAGETVIKLNDVATTAAADTVKAEKTVYVYSPAETEQIIKVRDAIRAIGDITAENYAAKTPVVATARAMYDMLTPAQKMKLTDDEAVLKNAEAAVKMYTDAADAAAKVDALIDDIGTVGVYSEEKIKAARDAYEALNDTAKGFVKDLKVLEAAEAAYQQLMADVKAAADTDALIDAIGEVTVASGDAIKAARDSYDALNNQAKAFVKGLDKLTAAEAAYANIAADKAAAAKVDEAIDAIGEVTADNFAEKADAIKAAEDAYAALTDAQKAYVTKKDALDAARKAYDGFKAAYEAMPSFKVELAKTGEGYTATVVNRKASEADPVVIVAVYDNTGALVKTEFAKASAGEVKVEAASNTKANVFVWDSVESMKPFADVEIAK